MSWRDRISAGLLSVATAIRTPIAPATSAHQNPDPTKGPRERSYSAQKAVIRQDWDVGADQVAWSLAEQGNLQLCVQLIEAMLGDGVIAGLMDTRSSGLLKLPVTITGDQELVAELTGGEKNVQKARSGLLWKMFPLATLARIIQFGILLGAGIGYFVQGENDPCPVLHVIEHQFLIHRRDADGTYRLFYRTQGDGEVEITPGDGRWFVFAPYGFHRFWLYGKWRAVGRQWLLKNACQEQRETWGQRLARGVLWISAPNSSNEDERAGIAQFFSSVVTPPIVAMLEGWKLDVHDVQGRGFEVWKDGKEDADNEIRMALSGQLVTGGGQTLGFGSGNIFADISQTLIDANAEALAESIHNDGLEPWAEQRGLCGPWVEWDTTAPADKKLLGEALSAYGKGLSDAAKGQTDIGTDAKINVRSYAAKMGIELEEDAANDDGETQTVSGIKVRIEYPEGSIREGVGANGVPWQTLMSGAGYGEIPGTEGADGEALDCYVGPFGDAREAYVLEQMDFNGAFDEYKIFLGFFSLEHAQETFRRLSNPDNEGAWSVVPSSLIAGLVGEKRSSAAPETVDAPTVDAQTIEPTEQASIEAETEEVDPPTNEDSAALADYMTEHKIDRCEHGRVNGCDRCGIERKRVGIIGPDGKHAGWDIVWRAKPQTIAAEAPKKYSHIDFTPPSGARKEAKRGLELRREFGRGGTEVGVARARDISNGVKLSPDTVRRMKAFFDRHEVDKEGEGFSPGEEGYPSAGKIAWCLPGDAQVLLADGSTLPISKIVDERMSVDVVGVDESTGEIRIGKVSDWFVSPSTIDDFYIVGTQKQQRGGILLNTYVEATGDHPIWTPNGWVQASEMSGKKHARVWNWLEPDAEAYLIGTMLGDYCLSKGDQVRGSHSATQADWAKEKFRIFAALGGGMSECTSSAGYGAGLRQVRYHSSVNRPLSERIRPLVYRDGKRVITQEALQKMGVIGLAALICDDGSLHTDKRCGGESYRIHTEGFDLESVKTFAEWLAQMGIKSSVLKRENCDGHVVYVSRDGTKILSKMIAKYVPPCMRRKVCTVDRDVEYAFENRSFTPVMVTCWHETERHERCADDARRSRHERKRYLKRYDITVDGLHSFVANGVVVHNCLWGGDAGYAWARKVVRQMEAADDA